MKLAPALLILFVFLFNDSAWQIIGGYGHAVT